MSESDIRQLKQNWPLPPEPKPIVIIGAGGIVNDAHLPAYAKASLPVAGLFDLDRERSRATAERFQIETVFGSLEEAFGAKDAVFDLAVPPQATFEVLQSVPSRSTVLIQKPLGTDLEDARRIRTLCREKSICAAVNFQLRFSSMMLAIRDAIRKGMLGKVIDLEVRLNVRTPWELFPFLKKLERVEIQVHSVHYLDWVRSVLGEPQGVYARTVAHPDFPDLKSTRTSAILDYGGEIRCCLSINHDFVSGRRHQAAGVTLTGTKGSAVGSLGTLLNYPTGEPDTLEIITQGTEWTAVPLEGRWFPDAFIGTMANLQRFAAGEDRELVSRVEDAFQTMALVEACYQSDAKGGTPIPE